MSLIILRNFTALRKWSLLITKTVFPATVRSLGITWSFPMFSSFPPLRETANSSTLLPNPVSGPFTTLQRKTQAAHIQLRFTSCLHQFLHKTQQKLFLSSSSSPIFSIIPPSFSTSKTSNLIQDMDIFSHLRFIPQPAPICFLLPHSTKTNFTKITNHLWH